MNDFDGENPFSFENADEEDDGENQENFYYVNGGDEITDKNELKELFAIEELVKRRLAMIANSPEKSRAAKLLMLDPFAFHQNSIVFNAVDKGEEGKECFVEVSRLPAGIFTGNDTVVCCKDIPGIPRLDTFIEDPKTKDYIAVVYEKISDASDFDLYYRKKSSEVAYFLAALKLLIEKVHARKIILPPNWDEKGILCVGRDKTPVFIGYNETVTWCGDKEFRAACEGDWLIFLALVTDFETYVPEEFCALFKKLIQEAFSKLEAMSAAE